MAGSEKKKGGARFEDGRKKKIGVGTQVSHDSAL